MISSENIRNFVIIAHIDHGKSTLADRLLEVTGTVEKRLMKPQFLDQLELERERGITIKMAPVRMTYKLTTTNQQLTTGHKSSVISHQLSNSEYILNLIDTPGHADFRYEVSRALAAVEGAVLLVDATQGIQAQTLANFESARKAGLVVIGAVNKIDVASPEQVEAAMKEVAELLGIKEEHIFKVSGKTGEGVPELIKAIIEAVPPPRPSVFAPLDTIAHFGRALVFDSLYDEHRGVIAFIRVFDGSFEAGEDLSFLVTKAQFRAKEIGYFTPTLKPARRLGIGETGYIATGLKDPDKLRIGDTLVVEREDVGQIHEPLSGYQEPQPVVFVSFYPEDPSLYDNLRQALGHLRLNDAALHFDPDMSEVLGRGFKGGFLGRLHFEITADRLFREFKIQTVHSFPSVAYQVKLKGDGWITITNPKDFPIEAAEILEPITKIEVITPAMYIGPILQLKEVFRFGDIEVKTIGAKTLITAKLPLADLISDLDDKLKSVSAGFASLSYETVGWEKADVEKMEILVAGKIVPGLTRIIPRRDSDRDARIMVEKLKQLLPTQQFTQAIQAMVRGKIIARETIPAMRKDVTGYLYGGDRTRKMKLWKKQQRGKKRLKEMGTKADIKIPANIFKELLKR